MDSFQLKNTKDWPGWFVFITPRLRSGRIEFKYEVVEYDDKHERNVRRSSGCVDEADFSEWMHNKRLQGWRVCK